MKNAVLLTSISAATFLFTTQADAQHTAAGITTTISAANTVNQSQQAPARDPKVAARYGNDVADRQARAQQQRRPQQLPPGFAVPQQQGRATQLANPAVAAQQPQAPARDPKVAARYGNAVADRQARAQQQRQPQASPYGQPSVGQPATAVPATYRAPVKRAPDPKQEQRIVEFQRQKAISGNPTSQYDLGMRYLKGNGVEKDREQALSWLKMSAKGGYSRAKKQLDTLSKQAAPTADTK